MQDHTCQKVDKDFSKQMWSSRIIQTLSHSFSVGPVILTIPSYFTFTIKEHPRKYFYNETVGVNDLELQNAMETNYTNYWQTGNDTWLMKKNSTQYYMYYR